MNRMIKSLNDNDSWNNECECLCSWNGNERESKKINARGINLKIIEAKPYHFASNMNMLIERASSNVLLVINDDVILDKDVIQKAYNILEKNKNIAVIGSVLRNSDGYINHAGILYDDNWTPYNQFHPQLQVLPSEIENRIDELTYVPAVTGALMMIRKDRIEGVRFRTTFVNCCEDVCLALDLKTICNKDTAISKEFTAIHNEKTTRGETNDTQDFKNISSIIKEKEIDSNSLRELNANLRRSEYIWLISRSTSKQVEYLEEKSKLERLRIDHENLHRELRKAILYYENEVTHLRAIIDRLMGSTSWKITKPIRFVLDFLHSITTRFKQ